MNFQITSGKDTTKGVKAVIYGVEGVGKTTLAAQLPDPLFIDTEGSTAHFANVKRLPEPTGWKELQEMVSFVSDTKPCKTLVIDSFDWAERMEVNDLIASNPKWTSIESIGYGKGWVMSAERIAQFMDALDKKLIAKGINVCLVIHADKKKFEMPEERGAYDQWTLALGSKKDSKTAPIVLQWADLVLFLTYKTYVEMVGDKAKASGGKERVMYCNHSAVWDAKNRFGLPDELPLSYEPISWIFGGADETPAPTVPADQEEPPADFLAEMATADPEPAMQAEPTPQPFNLYAVTFPEAVPQYVKDFCKERSIYPGEIQKYLFDSGAVAEETFDLALVPEDEFWKPFVNTFDELFAESFAKTQEDALPF